MTTNNPPDGHKGRNGSGQYTKSIEGAERDAQAARLHAAGHSYNRIATELGIHRSQAIRAVQRAVRAVVQGPAEQVLQLHTSRLEYAYTKAIEIAEADHIMVSHGKIICDENGIPLRDHGPTLAALREARATLESFRRMMGLDQPVKVDATVHQVTQQDIELAELVREAQAKNAVTEAAIRGETPAP
jgi:hypothetical protein